MSTFQHLKRAVAHDACHEGDRYPLGAVPAGTPVQVTLRIDAAVRPDVESVSVLVFENGIWHECGTWQHETGFSSRLEFSGEPHVAFYVFELQLAGGSPAYYVPCIDGRSTAGDLVFPGDDGEWAESGWAFSGELAARRPGGDIGLAWVLPGFQVTLYKPGFQTPEWLAGAVMYQIFPDRFALGAGGARRRGVDYHKRMHRPVKLHDSWDEPVYWVDGPSYDPIDFYGGTLEGIRENLPYLASLGVSVLYLNPVFEARSNHRYDTADYERIDPLLGTTRDMKRLTSEARKWGITIVLDAVLSHTGNDSRYFNALETYAGLGAAQGPDSPFYDWYDFTKNEDGSVSYRSWWGFPSLPEVDEHRLSWQRYMFGDDASKVEGVLPKWLHAGVGGYRLDVADELPDDVLEGIRASAKSADPQAAIIGEVWEDATTKTGCGAFRNYALGYSLDSVMNYPLRSALLGFALEALDAYQLAAFLKSQQSNYPPPMYRCLMNLLSTHDVERVRSALAVGKSIRNLPRSEQVDLVEAITPEADERAARLQCMIAGIMYALPGVPCLYYGDERGMQGGRDPFCRATFPWSGDRADCGVDVTDYYREIGMRRKGSPALATGSCSITATSADTLCIVRIHESGDAALVVANRSSETARFAFDGRGVVGPTTLFEGVQVEDGIVSGLAAPAATTFFGGATSA